MKRLLSAAAVLLASTSALATDVGVSVSVDKPGFYGSIDIGNAPRPRVISAEPVIIQPVVGVVQPVYMHVPPGHAKKWGRYCHQYNACARPVLFVTEDWYQGSYVPHYRETHGGKHPGGKHHSGKHHSGKNQGDKNQGGKHHGGGHGKDHGKGRD